MSGVIVYGTCNMLTNIKLAAVVAVALAFTFLLVSNASLKAKIAHKDNDLLQSEVSINALSSSNDNQAATIKRMERDYNIVTELNSQHLKQVAELETAAAHKQERANKLRTSDDEQTRTWANTELPTDALQLLKQTDCQSSDRNQDGVCVTAD